MGRIVDFIKKILGLNKELTKEEEQIYLKKLITRIKES